MSHRPEKADNSAFVQDGIVWSVQKGPQTRQSVSRLREQTGKLIAAQRLAGQKAKVLAELSKVPHTDSGARLEAKAFLDEDFDALAVVGNKYLQPIVMYVLKITGKQDKVSYFASQGEALAWLKDPRSGGSGKKKLPVRSHLLQFASVIVVLLAITATLVVWRQSEMRVAENSHAKLADQLTNVQKESSSRLQAYVDALKGFRGLFHSSDQVSEGEFETFFGSLDLQQYYPGFNAISFVTRVSEKDRQAFLARIRTDESVQPQGEPDFTIVPSGNRSEYFVRTYVEGVRTGKGVDLKVNEPRRKVLEYARDSGQEAATGTINLLDTDGKETAAKGFLLTLPVYTSNVPVTVEARRSQHSGFIDANFNYQIFLQDILKAAASSDIHAKFLDANQQVIYETAQKPSPDWHTTRAAVHVAGQNWTVEVSAPPGFGLNRTEKMLPYILLLAGMGLSAFLAILFWLQLRAERRAIGLAQIMTQDLQQERNSAIAVRNKDEAILSSIGDGVFALDMSGNIILFNAAAELITGLSAKDIIGKPYHAVLRFRDENGTKVRDQFISDAQNGHLSAMPRGTTVVTNKGQLLPVADSAAPIFDAKGQQQGVIVVFRDISAEREFQERLSQLAAIVESSDDAIISNDLGGNVVSWNGGAERLYGYSASDMVGKSLAKLLPEDRSFELKEIVEKIKKGEQVIHRETVRRTKDGREIEVSISVSPIKDDEGRVVGASSIARDITQEKHFERVIRESNERFELVAKATSEVVYDLNLRTGDFWWNDALYAQYGYNKQQVTNDLEWWTSHVHPDDALRVNDELTKLLNGESFTWTIEYRFEKSDGTYAFVRDRAFVQRDHTDQPVRMVGSLLDVTKQKELDRAKDEFISLVSHQLRTPLTAIRLFTEMLTAGQVGELQPAQQDYLEKIDISTKRMIQLVGDILNISRIEMGRLKIEPKPTDVPALIASYIDEVSPLAAQKNVEIIFHPSHMDKVVVDPILFGQIIHNFLTNAIRYSREGHGKVEVSFQKTSQGYELQVKDDGLGIPEKDQPHIFQRFFRADNAIRAEGEGTGLGLYLIRMIMEQAGGGVRFESQEGKGAAFYATLPESGMKIKHGEKGLS